MKTVDRVSLIVVAVIILAVLVWEPAKNIIQKQQPVASVSTNEPIPLTQRQHLEILKSSLQKISTSSKVITYEDISYWNDARDSYNKITDTSLLAEKNAYKKKLEIVEARINKDQDNMRVLEEKRARANIAKKIEDGFLEHGKDVYVSVTGKQNEILKLKYILVSRPFVHSLKNDEDFVRLIKHAKFKKVILTDGFGESWELRNND